MNKSFVFRATPQKNPVPTSESLIQESQKDITDFSSTDDDIRDYFLKKQSDDPSWMPSFQLLCDYTAASNELFVYRCSRCDHLYEPFDTIDGVPFHMLPDNWRCLTCKSRKSRFSYSIFTDYTELKHRFRTRPRGQQHINMMFQQARHPTNKKKGKRYTKS